MSGPVPGAGPGPLPLAPTRRTLAAAVLRRGRGRALPAGPVLVPDVRVDPAHLDAWGRVCHVRPGAALPACYLHVLTWGAQARLLLGPGFPLAPVGLVHLAQRLEVLRPVDPREVLALRVAARDLRPHRRGRQVDLVATAEAGGEVVWRGTSTYLRREPGAGGGPPSTSRQAPDGGAPSTTDGGAPSTTDGGVDAALRGPLPDGVVRWDVPAGTGRAYAAVAGDPNPLHTSALAARALGFPRPLAHGMWTLARALGDLQGRAPVTGVVDARFRKPLLVPGRAVHGWHRREDGSLLLAVRRERDGEPHLVADVVPGA
ncbi:MaoC/PaaZ C-terminal domain-containing protein [Pseudokineococcus lusitanus]|uniref:MaoC dehydratase-like protein n=1 Tax=Pseudokineococcus lusitanus TaxID=763993 RepID=A0A3N1HKC6_9ACTN|nr:MaoC/PaaZ C-terminal domain-containing protein [Pseudokineococcus lusitanus]ROP42973.1 MaoC dehydratase-like protein [Pseudokineococcus lusitanus]